MFVRPAQKQSDIRRSMYVVPRYSTLSLSPQEMTATLAHHKVRSCRAKGRADDDHGARWCGGQIPQEGMPPALVLTWKLKRRGGVKRAWGEWTVDSESSHPEIQRVRVKTRVRERLYIFGIIQMTDERTQVKQSTNTWYHSWG